MRQPNILFIMMDQLRWDTIGPSGGWVKTPQMDRIMDEGVRYTQCFTNSPVCMPARISLATGLYPHNHGVCLNVDEYDMPPDISTWMSELRSAGYETSLFGKTHLHRHSGDLRDREHLMHAYGFDIVDEIGGPRASMNVRSHMTDEWDRLGWWEKYIEDYKDRFANKPYTARPSVLPLELYADVYVGRRADEYLSNVSADRPWFCMVSFGGPHEPWDAPEPYASMYDPADMPDPQPRPSDAETNRNRAGWLHRIMSQGDRHSPPLTHEEIAAMRANYAGNVTLIDDQIGRLLHTLERRDLLEQTAIVITSDHGEMNGDYGLIYKENFLNSAVRVPLVVRTPETAASEAAGSTSDAIVELFDVGATLLELGGMEHDKEFRFARSFLKTLYDPELSHRKEALVEVHGEYLLQDKEWKLALNRAGEPYLMFHITEEPDEQRNLATDLTYRQERESLQIRLLSRLASSQWVQN